MFITLPCQNVALSKKTRLKVKRKIEKSSENGIELYVKNHIQSVLILKIIKNFSWERTLKIFLFNSH